MKKTVDEKVMLCGLLEEYFDARLAENPRRPGVECPVTKEYAGKLQAGLLDLRAKGKRQVAKLKKELAEAEHVVPKPRSWGY
jgi:hypothetical protein